MPTYAVARIHVHYGKLPQFIAAMEKLVPLMAESGWRLESSFQTIIGNFHEVYDIWEIPDANSVGESLAVAGADPRFPEIGALLTEAIESETLTVVAKLPFSP